MLFNVAQLLRAPVGETRRYTIDPEPPLRTGQVELVRTPGSVLVRVHGEAAIETECSRCLAPFCYLLPLDFEEVFLQRVDLDGSALPPPADGDEAFVISESHLIDITEAVRQYYEMAAAMQPLCRPACPGLCPLCGQDLNTTTCACERQHGDSRWAALAALGRAKQ